MATASQASLHMRSADLIKKEALDYGGFGEVYLCYHVTLGQVVMKTMYTGPISTVLPGSSDRSGPVPVEASIEDMHDIQYEPSLGSLQADAKTTPPALEEKLDRELQYHKHGSYYSESRPDDAHCLRHSSSNPFLQNHAGPSDHGIRQPEPDRTSVASSVHSWTKAEPVQPSSQGKGCYRPTAGLYESMNSAASTPSYSPMSASNPSLAPANQQHPLSHYGRQQSWPVYPVSDTSAPGLPLTPCKQQQDSVGDAEFNVLFCSVFVPASLFITNASGIQIGSNNTMNFRGYDATASLMSLPGGASATSPIKEGILKYEDRPVSEEHLDLLRDNIGATWKRCARRLLLTEVEIETIEHDYDRSGLPEMVHQMLERWKMKEGSIGCTVGKLCRALEGHIKVDVIQKILDTCSSSS
ncbi:Receptor-interacting serine/threonine-protein kinase 1 [Liparis tanakae]|uniref:Receptor-interacting serine/threonine-protein kinase 1 n=1 Tax=Liparis tanakae TaxID=230148 RepID=A0A4Z2HBB0_9TELE|nr:Receptor-interacting serine/threonine-protein kinase 1 [Liparis tanakae]